MIINIFGMSLECLKNMWWNNIKKNNVELYIWYVYIYIYINVFIFYNKVWFMYIFLVGIFKMN